MQHRILPANVLHELMKLKDAINHSRSESISLVKIDIFTFFSSKGH